LRDHSDGIWNESQATVSWKLFWRNYMIHNWHFHAT
jgi:hypothetical protein